VGRIERRPTHREDAIRPVSRANSANNPPTDSGWQGTGGLHMAAEMRRRPCRTPCRGDPATPSRWSHGFDPVGPHVGEARGPTQVVRIRGRLDQQSRFGVSPNSCSGRPTCIASLVPAIRGDAMQARTTRAIGACAFAGLIVAGCGSGSSATKASSSRPRSPAAIAPTTAPPPTTTSTPTTTSGATAARITCQPEQLTNGLLVGTRGSCWPWPADRQPDEYQHYRLHVVWVSGPRVAHWS
jgi:hypothetical protein